MEDGAHEWPLWEIFGLAIALGTPWKQLGLDTLGADMQGSARHQSLLAAFDKLFV